MPRRSIALASVGAIPITGDALRALIDVGVDALEACKLSERSARMLLAVSNPSDDTPECFQSEFSPRDVACNGCVFFVSCWRGCTSYLVALADGAEPRPIGVPDSVVDAALKRRRAAMPPPPPSKARRLPSPPMRRR